jgi:hypothetical protein
MNRRWRTGARLAAACSVACPIVVLPAAPAAGPESTGSTELVALAPVGPFDVTSSDDLAQAKLANVAPKSSGEIAGSVTVTSSTSSSGTTVTSSPGGTSTTATQLPSAPAVTTVAPPPATTTTTSAPPEPEPLPPLLFGLGPTADSASASRLATEAPVGILTTWYNGPGDLPWITAWRDNVVPAAYARGQALHLVVFNDDPESSFTTDLGTACGRPYPLSDRFLDDMAQLAGAFAGAPEGPVLYVTMFTELQTYACTDNAWDATPESNTYFRALQERYLEAVAVFHANAPNVRVSIGWGGWQARWDDADHDGGRSMIDHFAPAMQASDFQSVQAMQSDSNVSDVRAMTRLLGRYGPVMVAHFKPDNGSQPTFDADLRALFTDDNVRDLQADGLFAFSFMDQVNVNSSEAAFQSVAGVVRRYGS